MIRFRHGSKSYEIIEMLLNKVGFKKLSVVDLTYGVGRFYRLSRRRITRLVGVDIIKHPWEVVPDEFYLMSSEAFVCKVLRGEIKLERPDLIVVDPPWSSTKRGVAAKGLGISNLPYHVRANPNTIIWAATKLASSFRSPLLYRYCRPLPYQHLVAAVAEVKIMRNQGLIYYGIVEVR
jgi:hypothetical protein